MDTATTEIYTYLHTLSLHDALPISRRDARRRWRHRSGGAQPAPPASAAALGARDRRARPPRRARSEEHTSELQSLMRISYAVFCLKKKKPNHPTQTRHIIMNTTQHDRNHRTTHNKDNRHQQR